MRSLILALCLVAVWASPASATPDDPQVEVAVFVVAKKRLPSASHATLLGTLEKALRKDRRVILVDKDRRLAERGRLVPKAAISEARGLLTSGVAMLRKGLLGAALARLRAAEEQLGRALAFVTKRQLARAQFYIGVAEAALGSRRAAQATFERLLTWRPEYVADTSVAPAKVLPLWARAQRRVKKRRGGSIELASSPAGAMAYVDGRFVGFTPTTAEGLTAGDHYVTYRKLGYVRQVVRTKVSGKKQNKQRVVMQRTPGYDRMVLLMRAVATGSTETRAAEELSSLGTALGIEHAVFVEVAGSGAKKTFRARLYQVSSRKQLAKVSAKIGEEGSIEEVFGQMARSLYANVVLRPKPKPKPKKVVAKKPKRRGGAPFYKRWWFWTGVSAVAATAITVPLLMADGDSGPSCPGGATCGEVILRF